jgi:ATP-dependent RNA helicase RhlB
MTDTHLSADVRFDSLPLTPELLRQALTEAGFTHCTPIQAATLPLMLEGRDVAGQAQTGTGKTAAFLLALYAPPAHPPADAQRKPTQPRALVLAPTRELAMQIHKRCGGAGQAHRPAPRPGLRRHRLRQQRQHLAEGVDVLIGTPGRFIDFFKQQVFDLRGPGGGAGRGRPHVRLGFIKDIRFLLRRCPTRNSASTCCFPPPCPPGEELAYEHMNNPESVTVEAEQVTADRVRQCSTCRPTRRKMPLLVGLLRRTWTRPHHRLRQHQARRRPGLVARLKGNDIQDRRAVRGRAPEASASPCCAVPAPASCRCSSPPTWPPAACTSRNVSHVINYDLPEDPEDYVHRIGRTARAGADGDAISFACETYAMALPDIEAFIEQTLSKETQHDDLLVELKPRAPIHRHNRGGQGKKGGGGGRPGNRRGGNRGGGGNRRGGSGGR